MRIFHTIVVFSVLNITMNMSVYAQTFVSAGSVSGTWSSSGSPFLVQGSIIIPDGQTLTIDPGVNVIFQGSYQMFVQGRILAEGTVSDSITFTAQDTTIGWRGIRFDNTPTTNDSSKIMFCKILHGKNLNYLYNGNGGGLYINNFTKIKLSDCLFQFCKTACSGCNGSNGMGAGLYSNSTIHISNTKFINNQATTGGGGGGIFLIPTSGISTITNCSFLNNSAFKYAGIYSQLTQIDNCVISNNSSGEEGAGVWISGVNSKLTNSTITYNSAGRYGGGVVCVNGLVYNNIITNNSTGWYGGGISGRGTFSNNIISNNFSTGTGSDDGGGGISLDGSSIIRENTITNNQCQKNGGGLLSKGGNIKGIINNFISNNQASSAGGGIHFGGNSGSSADSLIGNVIANNSAISGGAIGITSNNSAPKILNNTIANNSATNGGAFYAPTNNSPVFKNCIIYGNSASQTGNQIYLSDQASQPSFYNCNIQGGSSNFFTNGNFYTGTYSNNLDTNPLFINPTAGSGINFSSSTANWRLQSASPCIDAGIAITSLPLLDLDSSFRVQGSSVDIGAYEYLSTCSSTTTPTFGSIGPFCQNSIPTTLPLMSINGIYGTWNPAVISTSNIGSLPYTFTPYTGQCGNSATITVNISSSSPSAIINQNGPIFACAGETVLLSCDDNLAYNYQWYLNGNPINGANTSEFNPLVSGNYTVMVSQSNCQSTSSPISVTFYSLPSTPTITGTGQITACSGGSVTLTANTGYSNYTWSNGATGNPITVTQSGDYTVSVMSSNGCNGISQSYIVNASFMQAPQLCLVGLDSLTNENRIIWEKPNSLGIDSFYVYKETSTANLYAKIGATDYNDLGLFLDVNSNPSIQAYRYRISILDTCGVETNLSDFHKTIHLTINQGVGGAWNLIWNHYEGINFSSYNIYRGSDLSNITLLTTIQSNLNSYTDLTPPAGTLFYQIEVVNPLDCDPTKSSGYGVSRSNVSNNGLAEVSIIENALIKIYPNPAENFINFEVTGSMLGKQYSICDVSGRKLINGLINSPKGTLLLNELSKGTYYMFIEGLVVEKIILN